MLRVIDKDGVTHLFDNVLEAVPASDGALEIETSGGPAVVLDWKRMEWINE